MSSPKKNKTEKRLETLAVKTKAQKQAFIEQLPKYPIVQVACEKSGVGRSTYYAWRKDDRDFAKEADKAMKSGEFFINDMAESRLIQNIQNGHTTSIIFWLKNHHKSYNERIMHEHEHSLELVSEDRKAIIKALINIGLGNVIKNNDPKEMNEAVKEMAQEKEQYRKSWEDIGKNVQKKEEVDDIEEEPPFQPQTIAMPSAPAKPTPQPPPVEKPYIRMKDRKGVNLKEFFKKREEERRRLEGK